MASRNDFERETPYSFDPHSCLLVIACGFFPGVTQMIFEVIKQERGPHRRFDDVLLFEDNKVTPELEALKRQTEHKIVLAATGDPGRLALRYLCDDCHLPREQRRVQWVHTISAGFDSLRLQETPEIMKDLLITSGKSVQSKAIAEYCLYSILYFSRKTWQHQANLREHRWEPYNISELYGKKMVIFGYGSIGENVAKRALGFDMEVAGLKRSRSAQETDELGVRLYSMADDADTLLAEADFVINCMPGTPENVDFFNKDRFAKMKSTAVYVNVGRGSTNSEEDLVEALRGDVIRGAALDVFKTEPLPDDHPLWTISQEKLILTPHNSASDAMQRSGLTKAFLRIADGLAKGQWPTQSCINKEILY